MNKIHLLPTRALPVLLCLHAAAQHPVLNWDAVYYTGQGNNTGKCIVAGADSAVYSFGEGGNYCYLAKYSDSDGAQQWLAQWDSATVAVDLVQHPNGMLVAAWVFYNQPYNSPRDIALSAFSPAGDTLWNFVWNDSLDRDDVVRDVHVDANGDIVLCAVTEQLIGNPQAYTNMTVIKLDAAGHLLWRRTWNGPNNNEDQPNAIWTDADANVYVAGYSYNGPLVDNDLVLLKYDAAGVFQWQRTINRNTGFGSHVDVGMRVVVDNDGNPLVAGITESPGSNSGEDISAYRYDPQGNLIEQYHYDLWNEESVVDMVVDAANATYLLGHSATFNGDGQVLMRLAPGGGITWGTTSLTNGLGAPQPTAMALASDGSIITTGYAGDQLLRDSYVLVYHDDGTESWSHIFTAPGSFNKEEGHDVAVGANNNIYVTGMYEQSGQSLIRGVTYCLCPEKEGICLQAPVAQATSAGLPFTAGDYDNDGWRDMVINAPFLNALAVYHGSANGLALTLPVSLPGQADMLLSGDLDQDGDPDMLAASLGATGLWMVTDNSGTLVYSNLINTPYPVMSMRIADMDGVNGQDIVVIMNDGSFLLVLLNNGNGSFTPSTPTGPSYPYSLALGDVDGDNDQDIVIGRVGQDSAFVMNGDGAGGFSAPHGYAMSLLSAAMVAVGDMDFDSINDLIASNAIAIWSMRPGLGSGAFGPPQFGSVSNPIDLVIAPFAQDTSFRMLAGCLGKVQKVVLSHCSGTLTTTDLNTTLTGRHHVDVADWTNDGSPDIMDYYTEGEATIWPNCDTTGSNVGIPNLVRPVAADGLLAYAGPPGTITVMRPAGVNGSAEYSIWSLSGDRLRGWSSTASATTASAHGLATGVYVVRCTTGDSAWTTRLVLPRSE